LADYRIRVNAIASLPSKSTTEHYGVASLIMLDAMLLHLTSEDRCKLTLYAMADLGSQWRLSS